jgi:branched-chain amino acid transport system permease protein
VMTVSDHVTVLDYGRVIASGSAAQVQKNAVVIEAYFGHGRVVPTRSPSPVLLDQPGAAE